MDEEKIFKALADESRRILLDALFAEDGQSLSQLEARLPMTRFGVMKHLQLLEEAGLITTRKVGREKYHYLNPVPIQTVYDRWVSKYAQPWVQSLSSLKMTLEHDTMWQKPTHIFQTYIRTTPEKLWQAITDGTFTQQYYMNTQVQAAWSVGEKYQYLQKDGNAMIEGTIIECDPPRRLVTTFEALWIVPDERGLPSKVSWDIEPQGTICRLIVTHDELDPALKFTQTINTGWSQILAGLKTLLETGEPLIFIVP